ncbi:MAG TPA: DMT family transporter [Pseudobdellovibrionaceae bacterium]|nr:DMT family transporter [Pseudobdellovibrionaceae bacterium]
MNPNTNTISFSHGLSLNILSVLLNAIAMTLSKFALNKINPIFITLIISLTSLGLSFLYLLYQKHKFKLSELKQITPIAITNAVAAILLYTSIAILDPVTVGLIGRFYVVFTTLLSILILKEKISFIEFVFILIAIAGTFLFVKSDMNTGDVRFVGLLFGFAYTFLFALANLFVKKSVHNMSSVLILFYNNLFGVFASIMLLLLQRPTTSTLMDINSNSLFFAVLTASITFGGLVLFFNSFRFLSFKLSNLIRSTSPLFVMAVSWPFFPIKLGLANASGGILVLISIVFLSLIEKRKHK